VNGDPDVKLIPDVTSDGPRMGEILDVPACDTEKEKPVPLGALLTRPVVVSVANYGMIGLLEMTAVALIPLIWSTSVEYGGLGMSPPSIGSWMAGYGLINGAFQYVAFPRIVGRLGPQRVFIASVLCFFPVYFMFPFENLALRQANGRPGVLSGLLIVLQLSAMSCTDMSFSESSFSSVLCAQSTESTRRGDDVHILRSTK